MLNSTLSSPLHLASSAAHIAPSCSCRLTVYITKILSWPDTSWLRLGTENGYPDIFCMFPQSVRTCRTFIKGVIDAGHLCFYTMHLTMYKTQLTAILNHSRYMYFHTQQPRYEQRPSFQYGKCPNFEIGMKIVIRSVGLFRKMSPFQVHRYELVKIIGVDWNFCWTRYVSREKFGIGVECIFHRYGSRDDSATAVYFLKLFT